MKKYLIDVNVLLAGIWTNHPHHSVVLPWLEGKQLVLCPLTELGFLRISTHPKASINAPMEKVRRLLENFSEERGAKRISDDLPALNSKAENSDSVTDFYLADLATKHGLKLATLDKGLKHPSVEQIA